MDDDETLYIDLETRVPIDEAVQDFFIVRIIQVLRIRGLSLSIRMGKAQLQNSLPSTNYRFQKK